MGTERAGLGPNFKRLFAAATISDLGDGILAAAVPLLAAQLTDDSRALGALVAATTLPWLVFTLFSGAIVDRVDRRSLMWRVDLSRALLIGLVAIIVATDHANIPTLAVAFFILGIGETLFDNAGIAFLPSIVAGEHLHKANGRLQAIGTVCNTLVGPPLGAFLFAAHATLPFTGDAISFAISALLIARIRPFQARVEDGSGANGESVGAVRRSIFRDIGEGLRFLRGHRLLRRLAASLGVWNLVANANGAMLVFVATRRFGLSEQGFGVLLSAMAIGGIVGGVAADRILSALGPRWSVRIALTASALAYLAVGAFPNVVVLTVALGIEGLAGTVWNVWTLTLRQELVPDRLIGRVTSAYRLVGVGTLPLGALIGGLMVRQWGLLSTYWMAGVAIAVLAGMSFTGALDRE